MKKHMNQLAAAVLAVTMAAGCGTATAAARTIENDPTLHTCGMFSYNVPEEFAEEISNNYWQFGEAAETEAPEIKDDETDEAEEGVAATYIKQMVEVTEEEPEAIEAPADKEEAAADEALDEEEGEFNWDDDEYWDDFDWDEYYDYYYGDYSDDYDDYYDDYYGYYDDYYSDYDYYDYYEDPGYIADLYVDCIETDLTPEEYFSAKIGEYADYYADSDFAYDFDEVYSEEEFKSDYLTGTVVTGSDYYTGYVTRKVYAVPNDEEGFIVCIAYSAMTRDIFDEYLDQVKEIEQTLRFDEDNTSAYEDAIKEANTSLDTVSYSAPENWKINTEGLFWGTPYGRTWDTGSADDYVELYVEEGTADDVDYYVELYSYYYGYDVEEIQNENGWVGSALTYSSDDYSERLVLASKDDKIVELYGYGSDTLINDLITLEQSLN